MRANYLAVKRTVLSVIFTTGLTLSQAQAGIPVLVDGGVNTMQTIMGTIESVAQTLKQIEQYKTQLQQYENMLQNTAAPAAYIWDQAQSTINSLLAAQDTLSYYQNQLGSLDDYLAKFQDVSYYRSSPCFNRSGGCTAAEQAAMESNRRLASESQKKANDALFQGMKKQQQALTSDAQQLQRLQSAAQGANGKMEAIGFANQLASNQANQLLQIRGLMLAQQNAVATKMQADADLEAQYSASREYLYKDLNRPTNRAKSKGY
ncbi:P-type conjugative transfer protein TrbJ [Pseudomonas sp. sia0905]|uniref:P-type conjugative transfer protein TrbJ n=1 Tax=Pseudomonas sp. sia0905 TaxID=2854783 RepID=UPI001C493132|nr:P-type conjugative transfer protein TrbJ [Pseudomonas sp. sia0905]MBV7563682.1 P-type conjugative transfer protein TrbJ [Pseudomonas sp. sia0905]